MGDACSLDIPPSTIYLLQTHGLLGPPEVNVSWMRRGSLLLQAACTAVCRCPASASTAAAAAAAAAQPPDGKKYDRYPPQYQTT